jgi:hypothetical protein
MGERHVRVYTTLNQDRGLPVDDLFGGVTGTHVVKWWWYRKCQYHPDKQHTRDDPTRQDSKKRICQHTKRGHLYIQFFKSISSSFPLLNLCWIENTNVVHLVWRTKLYDQHSGSHLTVSRNIDLVLFKRNQFPGKVFFTNRTELYPWVPDRQLLRCSCEGSVCRFLVNPSYVFPAAGFSSGYVRLEFWRKNWRKWDVKHTLFSSW